MWQLAGSRVVSVFLDGLQLGNQLRQAEVEELRFPELGHHDVRWLEIPVQHTLPVRSRQPPRQTARDPQYPFPPKRLGYRIQRLTADVLGHEVWTTLDLP